MNNSYIPLYRKYRPQKFSDLVGQEAVAKTLSNAIKLNKVAHAYLLTGPRGTGKTSTARIFAKSLNCENGPTDDPCGKCSSCLDITNGSAIDVIEIDAASNRGVEDARNLLEKVQFVPVSGKYKIYIIDEVHMLTDQAFNTLLKTLEEPPANLVFILATTESHKVLNTIISRCQRFDFRRIKQELIFGRLKEIIKIENLNIEDNALSLIARRSGGGLRDALSLLDQVSILSSINDDITENDVITLLGSLKEDFLYELAEAIGDKNSKKLLLLINNIIQSGNEPVQVIRELMGYFRNLLLVKTAEKIEDIKSLIDVSEEFYKQLANQSDKFEIIEITQIIEKLSSSEKTLKTASNQHLWLEISLISICHRQDIQLISDLEARISKLEGVIKGGNITPAVKKQESYTQNPYQNVQIPKPTREEERPPVVESIAPVVVKEAPEVANNPENVISNVNSALADCMNDVEENWKLLLEKIKQESPPTYARFINGRAVEISKDKVVIGFEKETFLKLAQDKVSILEKAAQKMFSTTPSINLKLSPITSEPPKPVQKAKNIEVKPAVQDVELPKNENFEQISQDFEEKSSPKDAAKYETFVDSDEDFVDEIKNVNIAPINLSDQAKMVMNIFSGKVIE